MWFVSNMYRIFVNCVLLASIALAAPDDRHKRHFSYIKDLITSALSGWYQSPLPPFPNVDLEDEYVLYKIPGYEDVLIRAKSNAPIVQETDYQPEEVLDINPFESYIGTNNPEDTLVAFQNVDNLLSTRVFNSQQTDLLKETMVPMISSLGGVKFIARDIKHFPSRPDEEVSNAVVKTNEVKLEEKLRTRYNSRQMEKNKPVINFSTDNNPKVSVVEEIDRSSTLPLCLQERIDKVVSLGTDPLSIVTSEQDPYASNPFLPSRPDDSLKIGLLLQPEYKYGESIVPSSHKLRPLKHLNELRHDTAVNVDLTNNAPNPNINKPHIVPSNQINALQTLGSVPPQYVVNLPDNLPQESKYIDAKTNIAETIPHFSYKQVNNNSSDVIKLEKEKDSLKTNDDKQNLWPNHQVHIPNGIHIGTIATENSNGTSLGNIQVQDNHDKDVNKNSADSGELKNESHYVFKKIRHNNLSNLRMTKEEVKINANADVSLPRLHVNESSRLNISRVNNKKVTEDLGKFIKHDKIKDNNNDILKSAENETLSEYIYELETHDKLKPFSIAKEKDELKTNNTHPPINNVHVSSTNITSVKKNESKITITDNVPKKSTLSNYIYEHVAHSNPLTFSLLKETDEYKANIHKDSTKLPSQKFNPFRDEKASREVLNNKDTKTSGARIDSHYTYKHISEINSNKTVINKAGDELKIQSYPNYLSTNLNPDSESYTTVKADEFVTNKITINPENYRTENKVDDLTVLIENAPVSFNNNPIVVAESNYMYHQNNADGSTMKIKGNKDGGVSINVSNQNTGRGDIPD